jgi:hypothetical protein
MVTFETLPAYGEAAALIGVVLLEALLLYVGYGFAEQVLGQRILDGVTQT